MSPNQAQELLESINKGIEQQEAVIVLCRTVIDVFEKQRSDIIRMLLKNDENI